MNGAQLDGRAITVNIARPREERSGGGGGGVVNMAAAAAAAADVANIAAAAAVADRDINWIGKTGHCFTIRAENGGSGTFRLFYLPLSRETDGLPLI